MSMIRWRLVLSLLSGFGSYSTASSRLATAMQTIHTHTNRYAEGCAPTPLSLCSLRVGGVWTVVAISAISLSIRAGGESVECTRWTLAVDITELPSVRPTNRRARETAP